MSRKQRPSGKAPRPPDAYTPPDIGTGTPTHPDVTKRKRRDRTPERRKFQVTYATGKVPFKYGLHRLPGQILYSFDRPTADEFWYVLGFCKGEVEGFQKVIRDVEEQTTLIDPYNRWRIWFYNGTAGQVADPNLGAVDPTWSTSPTAEDIKNVCYAVVKLMGVSKNHPQMPNFLFEIKTKKCIQPSTLTEAYSELPAVQFYDWLRHPEGKNLRASRINTASFIASALICEELVSGSPRFTCHASIEDQDTSDVEKMFALMCDGLFFQSQNQFHLVIDRPAASVATYTDAHFARDTEPEGYREDPREKVNQVIIEHTDRANGWKVVPARLATDAVNQGRERARPATYRMDWLHDPSVVQRKLVYLLNSYTFDFKLKLRHLASTSDRQVGEVITQSVAARGITAQMFRIVDRQKLPDNTFRDLLLEYNTARYSNAVASISAKIASTLPDAGATPPEVTSFNTGTITEELFARQPGDIVPRARVAWTNPNYSWLEAVELYVSISGGEYRYYDQYIGESGQAMIALVDGVLQINVSYSLKLVVRSRFGLRSVGVIATKTFVGKTTPPADVEGLIGGANGNQVFLWWQPSPDRDVKAFEIRRGTSSDTWSTAQYDGQTDVTSWADEPPHGDQLRYFVKAIDWAGRYSTNPATFDITMASSGAQVEGSFEWFRPDPLVFTRVAVPGDGNGRNGTDRLNLGLWYGTGNLIYEVANAIEDIDFGYNSVALLTRTFTPAAAETERAAGSYTTVGAWATAVDDPRRNGAPLWAPLPAGAQGEMWRSTGGVGGSGRLSENRVKLISVEHGGVDVPSSIAIAQPLFMDDYAAPTIKQYGNTCLSSAYSRNRGFGFRLSSNAPNYQQLVRTSLMNVGGFDARVNLRSTNERRPVTFVSSTATTDASGLVTIFYSYPLTSTGSAWLSITAIPQGAAAIAVVVDGVDTMAQTVRFRSFNTQTNAVAASIKFGYELTDNAGSTGVAWSTGSS